VPHDFFNDSMLSPPLGLQVSDPEVIDNVKHKHIAVMTLERLPSSKQYIKIGGVIDPIPQIPAARSTISSSREVVLLA
jgi:hypothetical protein